MYLFYDLKTRWGHVRSFSRVDISLAWLLVHAGLQYGVMKNDPVKLNMINNSVKNGNGNGT